MLKQSNRSESTLHFNEVEVNDKYKFLKQIGKGSYGEVWLVLPLHQPSSTKSNTKQYVLKRLNLQQSNETTQNDIEAAEREANLLSTLKHPNIVAYIESFRSKDDFLNIVMAYCEGGDLYSKLKERKTTKQPLGENQIVEWFVQICMALQYMHEKSILHRDLKTQNIFLTKNEIVKVGDLGIARVLDSGNDLATTIIGTPYYMSPEIFSNIPYGQKSDIWALGCCVYEMTTLEHAFNAKDMNSLVLKIIRGQTPATSKKYSEPLTALIKSMLSKNPDDRPTAKKILQNSYIKRHIMRLLEKTKVKCQNQGNPNPQVSVVDSSSTPLLSSSPPPAFSSPIPGNPPVPSLSNDAKSPHSSASSPSSRKSRGARSSNNNTPVLPSYPPLPPSHNRPSNNITTSSSGSSSSADASRSLPSVENDQPNDARARRRRLRARLSNPLPINEQQVDVSFLSKLSQNDTLQRRKRDQQIKNHIKQYQQVSSGDEREISSNVNPAQPVIVVVPPKRVLRPNSAGSSFESNHSKLSYNDDFYFSERETNKNSGQQLQQQHQQSESKTSKSYDSNNNFPNAKARQRRRDSRMQSSIESSNQIATNNSSCEVHHSTSQNSVSAGNEKEKEGEKDMNDFLFMLTATLQLAPIGLANVPDPESDSNELTNSSNDSDRTIVASDHSYSHSFLEGPTSRPWSSGDRTMEAPLHQTNHLYKRCQTLKEYCLREINREKLQRILNLLENVSEAQMASEMISELGECLYQKYAPQIFLLKFYEDNLRTHTQSQPDH